LKEGRASQRKLATLSFDAAGFGHGKPIARDASTRRRASAISGLTHNEKLVATHFG